MKYLVLAAALLLSAATAHALPRQILITINEAVYAIAPKPEKARKLAERYIDAPSIFGYSHTRLHGTTGESYGWSRHWAEHWTRKGEKLDGTDKIDTINGKLADAGITIIPTDDYMQSLTDAGLTVLPGGGTNTTTTAVGTTTTTTTAR